MVIVCTYKTYNSWKLDSCLMYMMLNIGFATERFQAFYTVYELTDENTHGSEDDRNREKNWRNENIDDGS